MKTFKAFFGNVNTALGLGSGVVMVQGPVFLEQQRSTVQQLHAIKSGHVA